ncbi:zinc finger FYVE domain-containing protein 9 isoform X2 [Cimex lectularius]|uniref:FYVE-type domain-containing protein n=1 Tax=Cimex lectularius TaxID=79782 RepID=A0A8I6SSD3_CIMLE|nr:zinc finger FYVE domain-containing protein 9 isoform X2 [Cimex lectularius]
MDKFAVDIEKVLDEFEYNEGREESIVPSVINNHALSISQKPFKTPASTYRRPAFEPINLADADFAATPINPQNYTSLIKQHNFQDVYNNSNNNGESESVNAISANCFNQNENSEEVEICSDGTPDLLDSNAIKPVQKNINEDPELHNQLPDITSVRNTGLVQIEKTDIQPVFDLIKQTKPVEDDLPPVVEVSSLIEEEDTKLKPVGFDNDNISEAELENYLKYLEEEISAIPKDSSKNCSVTESDDLLNTQKTPTEECDDSKNVAEQVQVISQVILEPETPGIADDLTGGEIEEDRDKDSFSIVRNISSEIYKITDVTEEDLQEDEVSLVEDNGILEIPNSLVIEEQCNASNCTNEQNPDEETSNQESEEIFVEARTSHEEPEDFHSKETDVNSIEINSVEVGEENEDCIAAENQVNENIENVEKSVSQESVVESGLVVENEGSYTTEAEEQSDQLNDERPVRPSTLPLESNLMLDSEESPTPTNISATNSSAPTSPMDKLGKVAPFWVPDTESDCCMQCRDKFTLIRRRHHCRACGLVLCSKCCNLKAPLEYMQFTEARICQPCFNIIYRVSLDDGRYNLGRQPNPNNPMEYCSMIPPLQQAASTLNQPPPSVLVPTGVLKREGRAKSDVPKQVIFSDGIRPGGDLTELDGPSESRLLPRRSVRKMAGPPNGSKSRGANSPAHQRPLDPTTQSYIPADSNLPPLVTIENGQLQFSDDVQEVADQTVKFAINNNLFVNIKRVKLDCCVKRECWSVSSEGLAFVGQDEIAIILEITENEVLPPVDIFHLINTLYLEASKGTTVSEMSFTPAFSNNMFNSKDHGGFLYIRPTFQCTTNLLLPPQPYLIAILVHSWETPWARLFPLRLVLRLGAEYRYYPCPLVSIRSRPPLYTDIGHTVMKILVDFRKYSYSLATVRGLLIHMEDRQTTILFPRNGYDQVVRALNNSNDGVLAFGANLSLEADSHLVCIQSTKDENTYNSQAINIQSKPRRVTGASFVVFKGALKTAGLSGKSSIVEDGLIVHLPSESMTNLRAALRDMKDYTISCGPNDEETVHLQWCADDTNFNIGVKSFIDDKPFDGVPSIRVHNGTDYPGIDQKKIIRWTEVFILKSEEGSKATDPLDISRVSESIASATCMALVPMLDSLADANLTPLAIRATIHPENVGYEAGSCGAKLPSVYMNRLDEELIRVLHQAAMSSHDSPAVLELVFRIMNHPQQ